MEFLSLSAKTEFTVLHSGSIFGFDFWGQALPYLRMYWAGGYFEHLPSSATSGQKQVAAGQISELRSLNWLKNGARILLIDIQV
jgi:hypothetical protein